MLILLFLCGAASASCAHQKCGLSYVWMYKRKVVDKTFAEYCPDDDPNHVPCTEECKGYYMEGVISFCFVQFNLIIDLRLKFEI